MNPPDIEQDSNSNNSQDTKPDDTNPQEDYYEWDDPILEVVIN